jgi:5-methyltetrahydropteroyltriglutamate--homocysteine methyltransferase
MTMIIPSNLGFPRIGARRELKKALEDFWAGRSDAASLEETARGLREAHWTLQKDLGIRHVPCNDFSLYDHVLDTAVMVDAVPDRYGDEPSALARYFAMARGSRRAPALEMTKWFDTNYHYIVPEFRRDQAFRLAWNKPLEEYGEARALGLGPGPWCWGR